VASVLMASFIWRNAQQRSGAAVAIDPDDIGGVVTRPRTIGSPGDATRWRSPASRWRGPFASYSMSVTGTPTADGLPSPGGAVVAGIAAARGADGAARGRRDGERRGTATTTRSIASKEIRTDVTLDASTRRIASQRPSRRR